MMIQRWRMFIMSWGGCLIEGIFIITIKHKTIQTHIDLVPERIIKQILNALEMDREEFLEVLMSCYTNIIRTNSFLSCLLLNFLSREILP